MTTTSTCEASARARSAKQSSPTGQRDLPRHSRAVTLTWRHALSLTPGARSSRSPVSVSEDHSVRRWTSRPSRDTANGSNSSSVGGSSADPVWILFMHR